MPEQRDLFGEKPVKQPRKTPAIIGDRRKHLESVIVANHYAHSVPSGKSYYFEHDGAVVVFSIPANKNIAKFLLGFAGSCWELTRLWAPDGHRSTLLTEAISISVKGLLQSEPLIDVLVSYADPNVGHGGGVYRAASWVYTGQSEESRYYMDQDGQVVSRRAFHSGDKFLKKAEIEAMGFTEHKKPGKHRYVRPISRAGKKAIAKLVHTVPEQS